MKLNLSVSEFAGIIGSKVTAPAAEIIDTIAFDTRKIFNPTTCVFFALEGNYRNGHDFIEEAYRKGIRIFVVKEGYHPIQYEALYLTVADPLEALQQLAFHHRRKFTYPVAAITGSVGKTTVKEWIYHLIGQERRVVRSPKSYNSQLGVALSLLEMNEQHEVALIEAGISRPHEMKVLEKMIQPDCGIITAIGSAHAENFASKEAHLSEKLELFTRSKKTWFNAEIQLTGTDIENIHGIPVRIADYQELLQYSPFQDRASLENLSLTIAFVQELGVNQSALIQRIQTLPRLALRMETFDGIQGNLIINDTYNLDLDALTQSLEFQLSIAKGNPRIAIIAIDELSDRQREEMERTLEAFHLHAVYLLKKGDVPPVEKIRDSIVLIKGARSLNSQNIAALFQLKKHKTVVEINFAAVRSNLNYFRSLLSNTTQLLVMVKAASYGSGAEKMAEFLQKEGVDYLGVAYADEGVELRKNGIRLPILVMNAEDDGFGDIIDYELEPAIFSYEMMDNFVKALIMRNKENYPVHLKIDTGMRRLGFEPSEIEKIADLFQAQPEIKLQGVYSHLADADNYEDDSFSLHQIELFRSTTAVLKERFAYPFACHIVNTEGIYLFKDAHFEMVRMGIGLYGFSSNAVVQKMLEPAIHWKSVISQIKMVPVGESVSYNRKFIAQKATRIAVVPVGYADGFRRALGYGKGGMVVGGKWCPVVGTVCMDMTMIDISEVDTFEGDIVEIIGKTQTLVDFSKLMETIPYEVLTSISKRVHRVYLDD